MLLVGGGVHDCWRWGHSQMGKAHPECLGCLYLESSVQAEGVEHLRKMIGVCCVRLEELVVFEFH